MIDARFQPIDAPVPPPPGGRRRSQFKASWSKTLDLLERELKYLGASEVIILADLSREHIRNDGWPRSTARPASPGVIVTFASKKLGSLRFECGTFINWEDNVRAIALTLEQLRAIDRYGATKGEQYTGWARLPPPGANGAPPGLRTAEDAVRWMLTLVGRTATPDEAGRVLRDSDALRTLYRDAAKRCHPDAGGTDALMERLAEARGLAEDAR
ncbi:MAG TPA: hypothetical protein PLU35_14735 [Phycisphaerales bacterium]|nr:hypothetical protein [Phycisphaerales bacterium]